MWYYNFRPGFQTTGIPPSLSIIRRSTEIVWEGKLSKSCGFVTTDIHTATTQR